jgi:hypothetical protein
VPDPSPRDPERSTRWHNKSMLQLAAECGRSIIFPVQCKYCRDLIFLFADPNGGFAIFDELGPPWPKHGCAGMRGTLLPYCFEPICYSPRYDMPIPLGTPFTPYKSGQRLSGAIVEVKSDRLPQSDRAIRNLVLYNGLSLFNIRSSHAITQHESCIAVYVTGIAIFTPGIGTLLANVEKIGHARSTDEAFALSKELERHRGHVREFGHP